MEEQALDLPEMPRGAAHNFSGEWPEFSREDMERFGRACVLAERERNAGIVEKTPAEAFCTPMHQGQLQRARETFAAAIRSPDGVAPDVAKLLAKKG